MMRAPYESLRAWQKAMDLIARTYRLVERLPDSEKSGLSAALKKAATTTATRIADAHGRPTPDAAANALEAALASLREADTSVLIAQRLAFLRPGHVRAYRKHLAATTHLIEVLRDDTLDALPDAA